MNDILTSILTSSVTAGMVTLVGSWYLKEKDFQYDYKKYILEKRQKSYEVCYNLLVQLDTYYDFARNNPTGEEIGHRIHYFFRLSDEKIYTYRETELYKIALSLSDAIRENRGWLSEAFINNLTSLYWSIDKPLNLIKNKGVPNGKGLEDIGIEFYDVIHKKTMIAYGQYFKDIKRLYDVSTFIKSKSLVKRVK